MHKTINLESLSTRVYGELFNYIKNKVNQINDQPSYIPKSKLLKEAKKTDADADVIVEEVKRDLSFEDSVDAKLVPLNSLTMSMMNKSIRNLVEKTNVWRQTTRQSLMGSVSGIMMNSAENQNQSTMRDSAVHHLNQLRAALSITDKNDYRELYYCK